MSHPRLEPDPSRLLWTVALVHVAFWTLAPMFAYSMLPLDTLELLGWGHEWQWGYYKHPPLGAWLGEAFLRLSGGRLESLYLLAQIIWLSTILYVYRAARLVLDTPRAVLATVLLEGSYFHTFLVPNVNMNSLQLPLWAAFSFHLLRLLQGGTRHWYALALIAASSLLVKYSGLLLLATGALLVLATPEGRRALRGPHPWLAAALALSLLLPHLHWLSQHGGLPWDYLHALRDDPRPWWWLHGIEPLRFAAGSLLGLLFSALIFLVLRQPGGWLRPSREAVFVLCLCLAPLLLGMLYGVISGSRLKSTWAFPFFNLVGIAAFLVIPTRIDAGRWRRAILALAATMILFASAHLAYKLGSDESKTAFDGRTLANTIASDWQSRIGRPLRIVAGDHVLTAVVAAYAPSRPSMLVNGDFAISLWLQPDDWQHHGGVVVCEAEDPCLPALTAGSLPARELGVDGRRVRYYLVPPQDDSPDPPMPDRPAPR